MMPPRPSVALPRLVAENREFLNSFNSDILHIRRKSYKAAQLLDVAFRRAVSRPDSKNRDSAASRGAAFLARTLAAPKHQGGTPGCSRMPLREVGPMADSKTTVPDSK